MINLAAMYEIGQNSERHKAWIKAAYWVETIGFSNSKDWFKARYKTSLTPSAIRCLETLKELWI